jgi:hypothetical protein
MAEIKQFNTRFQLKYDTYTNWKTNNPKLLKGEIAIATIDENADGVQNAPSVLIKIGDGTHQYNDLKFLSGKAADVYDWAKAEKKPEYKADEIDGLADYIAGEIQDTNTKYKIEQDAEDGHKLTLFSQEIGETEWTKVIDITTVDTVYDDTALAGRVSAVEGLVGSTEVATQIADAITKLNLADTYEAKGEAAKVQGNLDTHTSNADIHVTTSDKATWADKYTKSEIDAKMENVQGSLDDRYTKTEIDGKVETIEEALSDRYTKTEIDGKVETIEEALSDRYTKSEVEGLINSAGHLKRDIVEALPEAADADADTIYMIKVGTFESGDNYEEYMLIDGTLAKIGDTSIDLTPYAKSEDVASNIEDAVNSILGTDNDTDDKDTIKGAKAYAYAVAEQAAQDMAEGAQTYTDEEIAKLHNISKTGSTDDLVQGTKILVFNCGDSVCEDITIE